VDQHQRQQDRAEQGGPDPEGQDRHGIPGLTQVSLHLRSRELDLVADEVTDVVDDPAHQAGHAGLLRRGLDLVRHD